MDISSPVESARTITTTSGKGHFEGASEVGLDTTGIPWFGDTANNFADSTKPSRNYAHSFHYTNEAILSIAAYHLENRTDQDRILHVILQRVQDLHYFANDQLDVDLARA